MTTEEKTLLWRQPIWRGWRDIRMVTGLGRDVLLRLSKRDINPLPLKFDPDFGGYVMTQSAYVKWAEKE